MLDALSFQRFAHALHRRGYRLAARILTRAGRHLFAAHLPPEIAIGAGTELGYGGVGVVLHPEARIGREVLISPGVVIGGRSGRPGAPTIGDRVKIGAGAKILGPIRIGDEVLVGANAVVLADVEPGDVVAGVPAVSIKRPLRTVDGERGGRHDLR
jgi:serine O-acetyltransferase